MKEAEQARQKDTGVVDPTLGGGSDEARWEECMMAARAAYESGNLAGAARNLELALNEAEQFGDQDSRLGITLNNLGGFHKVQRRYGEAEPLYKRSLEIFEKTLGPEHPDVARSLDDLATCYEARGKYDKAEPLFKRALAILERELDPADEGTGVSLNNLAHLYRTLGRYSEAEPLFFHLTRHRISSGELGYYSAGPKSSSHVPKLLQRTIRRLQPRGDLDARQSCHHEGLNQWDAIPRLRIDRKTVA